MSSLATVRVFNRAPFTICYRAGDKEILLESGQWTEVPREFAALHLGRNSHLLVDWGLHRYRGLLPWPHITLASPIDRLMGYGTVGERIAHYMSDKLPIRLAPLGYWNRDAVMSERVQQLMDLCDEGDGKLTEWALCVTIPPELHKVPSPRRILFSMWETGNLPKTERAGGDWAALTNGWAEALIVPCLSQAEVWRRAGVKIPIYTCPLGINEEFQYLERPKRSKGTPFTILLYGMLTSRKSPIETIQLCWNALGDVEDWRLILKTRAGQLGAGGFTPRINDERITVINQDYTPAQMAQLCYQADLGVCLSKYEGWGLPFREMMATGLPVIVSEHSGHLEDCHPEYNITIPIVRIIGANEAYAGLGGWGEPDWALAAQALRQEYEAWHKRERRQSDMGRRAAAWIWARRSWLKTTERLLKIIKQVIENGAGNSPL